MISKYMAHVTVQLNYLHIAPRKVRLLVNALKGLSVNEAEAQLLFRPQRSSEPILKLLRSAVANAKQNRSINMNALIVENVRVDQGPMMKRFMPRAMGRATEIQKKMSHITLTLSERQYIKHPRFTIRVAEKAKKTKKKSVKKTHGDHTESAQTSVEKKPGFFKKMFNRKSV